MLTRRRILLGLLAVVLIACAGAYFVLSHGPGNISNPDVAFEEETPAPAPTSAPGKQEKAKPEFTWTTYGYSPDRRRSIDVPGSVVKPPFHRRWFYDGHGLLEFPPVMSERTLFILRDDGVLQALDKRSGKIRWSKHVGALAASSPHLDIPRERLYLTVLSHRRGGPGRVMAVSAKSGNTIWSRELPARTESSPVESGGTIFFGTENGSVYALKATTGAVRWTYRARGAVKGALALKDGKLYFGDYSGKVYALRAATGKRVWEASTQGARFGFASGRFYGNAVVAYGRVFIGNVDSYVYSFSAETGQLAWRTKTNGYVYASPTVGAAPGDKPTVYAGSYDGTFYALDARSGGVRWKYYAGGKISGGSTLLGDTIWFADLGRRRSLALDARTGKKVFEYPKGGYATLITDKKTLFLVGYGAMYALEPLTAAKQRKLITAKRRRARRAIERRRRCVGVAKRNYTGPRRRTLAFRRCVVRTNATRTPLYVIRERRAKRREEAKPAPRKRKRKTSGYQVPESFRGLIKERK